MIKDHILVKIDTLRKVILLADQAQKLSEALEENNQNLRIVLHSLIKDGKVSKRLADRDVIISLDNKKRS